MQYQLALKKPENLVRIRVVCTLQNITINPIAITNTTTITKFHNFRLTLPLPLRNFQISHHHDKNTRNLDFQEHYNYKNLLGIANVSNDEALKAENMTVLDVQRTSRGSARLNQVHMIMVVLMTSFVGQPSVCNGYRNYGITITSMITCQLKWWLPLPLQKILRRYKLYNITSIGLHNAGQDLTKSRT